VFFLLIEVPYRAKGSLECKYKLSWDAYEEMYRAQLGLCAICGERETRKSSNGSGDIRELSVDHCHSSSRVRGLLCAACNQAIGLMKDDPQRLRAAADYLS